MKIRRYMGSNTQEAILKVKMDLGSEALILNTKKVRQKGIFKIFSKPMIEVLAAVDDKKSDSSNRGSIKEDDKKPAQINVDVTDKTKIIKDEKIIQLESKVNSMEGILKKIYDKLNLNEKAEKTTTNDIGDNTSGYTEVFYNNLVKNDVEPEFARIIVNKVKERGLNNFGVDEVASAVFNTIASILGTPQPIRLIDDKKPTVVILTGPTGVGKTTTLAKLAASFTLNQKKSVGLITTDTYRISAVDQLKTYAEIMGVPLTVIYSIDEVLTALEGYSDMDLVLIDTAGRSYKDKSQFEDLGKLIELTKTEEIYVVLSATTSNKNVSEILANYSFLDKYKLILTKIDESSTDGVVLNSKWITNKSLSYVTTGQNVPDDIEVANISKITKNLMGSLN